LGLNIADARIIPLADDNSLSTFVVLEQTGSLINDPARLTQIKNRLEEALTMGDDHNLTVTRRAPRQVRMFPTPTNVSFATDETNHRTVMELIAGDRPGLLCEVGKALRAQQVAIQTAKIVTVGEKAEDVFYIITDDDERNPLTRECCDALRDALKESLDSPG